MSEQSFRNLIVWQKSSDLAYETYLSFRNIKDYSFKDQIQRAAMSISNNIAEGYARRSDRAFRNFLFIAKGSTAEVESMLVIANRLGYIDKTRFNELAKRTSEVGRLLTGFIRSLPAKDYQLRTKD